MTRIGVTGAFGFLGASFVAALLEGKRRPRRGDPEILAFASRTRSNPLFESSDVMVEDLDILDYEDMARKFSGLDALAHFAGRVDFRRSARRSVWDADALGSKRVFDAALAAGVPKLLYVSSVCALGPAPEGGLADESSAPYGDPRWPVSFASPAEALAAVEASASGDYGFLGKLRVAYFDAKLAGWELAKAYARDEGLPVVTIFPGTAVGPGDIHYSIAKLVDNAWEGRLPFSFGGVTAFVGSRDFAQGACLALSKGRTGEGYVLAGRDEDNLGYTRFQELVAQIAQREGLRRSGDRRRPGAGRAPSRPRVPPKALLLGLARAAELIAPAGDLTEALVLSGSVRNACSSAKARAELGYEPGSSLENAILECRRFSEASRSARCR